jgi:hypothetical protein
MLRQVGPGVDARLRLGVVNVGPGVAFKSVAILRNRTGRQVFLEKGRVDIGRLEPTDVHGSTPIDPNALPETAQSEVELAFQVREGEPVDVYELELVVVDSYSSESLTCTLRIPAIGTPGAFENGQVLEAPRIEFEVVDGSTAPQKTPSIEGASGEAGAARASNSGRTGILRTESSTAILRGTVSSGSGSFSLYATNLSLSSRHGSADKFYYADSRGERSFELETPVTLRTGVNLIAVVAKGVDGLEARRSAFVRRAETR